MRIAIAVTVIANTVEDVLVYKEYRQKDHGHNFERACEVAEESDIDDEPANYDYKKPLRCRVYPLADGEIHVEEVEI